MVVGQSDSLPQTAMKSTQLKCKALLALPSFEIFLTSDELFSWHAVDIIYLTLSPRFACVAGRHFECSDKTDRFQKSDNYRLKCFSSELRLNELQADSRKETDQPCFWISVRDAEWHSNEPVTRCAAEAFSRTLMLNGACSWRFEKIKYQPNCVGCETTTYWWGFSSAQGG